MAPRSARSRKEFVDDRVGLRLGLAGAIGLTRLASTLLFGVRPADPLRFASVSAFILLVAFAACVVPARRATKVDPLAALRQD
jgi:putative ABC transport system permease protein